CCYGINTVETARLAASAPVRRKKLPPTIRTFGRREDTFRKSAYLLFPCLPLYVLPIPCVRPYPRDSASHHGELDELPGGNSCIEVRVGLICDKMARSDSKTLLIVDDEKN